MDSQASDLARSSVLATAITAILSGAGVAQAQEQQQSPSLEEITVTGSRIRRDDFSTPTPTTVVNNEFMQGLGLVNMGEAMVQIPSNVSSFQPTSGDSANGNFFIGSTIANLRGLNPFFGSRTLTLVDTRRHVPTNQGDGVDLNFIPSVLIDRMEVVTGGASAAYGSGAIAGVTNILLDRDLDGGRVQLDFGQTGEGDGDDAHAGVAYGTPIGERGHFVVGVEAQQTDPIPNCASVRDWCARGVATVTNANSVTNAGFAGGNPAFPFFDTRLPNGLPQYLVTEGVREEWISEAGVFWLPGVALGNPATLQVTADGTGLTTWDPGTFGDQLFAPNAVGGSGKHFYEETNLRANVDRRVLFANFDFEINDALGMFVEASGGEVETTNVQESLNADYFCIQPDNAFIQSSPQVLAFVSDTANWAFPCATGVPFNKDFTNQVDTHNDTTTDLTRLAFGFDGQFGDSTWTWDAYYQFGESERTQFLDDNRHLNRFNLAADAIIDPATGQPACRYLVNGTLPTAVVNVIGAPGLAGAAEAGLIDALAPGCVPVNMFGTNTMTQEAEDYAFGFLREDTTVEQQVVSFIASGEVAEGWGAGALRAAGGVEYREESIENIAAEELPTPLRTDFLIQYGESFSGDVDVTEVFGEIDVPVVERFNFNAATRWSRYDNQGKEGTTGESRTHDITSWKLSANWDPLDALRLRFSQSRDIRAPNFRELYYGQIIGAGGIFGFVDNQWTANDMDPATWTLAGNVDLDPEEADTTTVGFILTPPGLEGFRVAADYFDIEISDAITPASIDLVMDGCFAGNATLCEFVNWNLPPAERAATMIDPANPTAGFTDVVTIRAEAFNFRSYEVKGIDLTADWLRELDEGTLSLRFIASHVMDQIINPSTTEPTLTQDLAGTTGSTNGFLADWAASPDWQGNLIASYARGRFTVTGQARYVSSGRNDIDLIGPDNPAFDPAMPDTVNDNTVPSHTVVNLSGTYDFQLTGGTTLQLFGVINNVADRDPPLIGSPTMLGSASAGTNAVFFDTLGRTYRLGVRMQF